MSRRPSPRPIPRPRVRSKQNILHTNTPKQPSRKQVLQVAAWCGLVLGMILGVGTVLHLGIAFALNHVLYDNPHYVLNKIEIEPRGHISEYLIRQAAGLERGQNLWSLNLHQISRDLERLPYVSNAKVERHFPDKITIHIKERTPAVKISGLNIDIGTRETFYVDRQGVVLKPRPDEAVPLLPEVVGLNDAELEPGTKLEQPSLTRAMEIIDAIDHSRLHTTIDIRTIDLSNPLSITMVTRQDMTIVFRLDYVDQQLIRLQQATAYAESVQRNLQSIDLTPDVNDPITFSSQY